MLAMLIYPFDFKYVSSWIYITLPPYLYLVCRDFAQTGYRRRDVLKAYTLFLLLLPVVLNGVKNSISQIVFGEKASFGRTPKIKERTIVPASILLAILGLLGWSMRTAYHDVLVKMDLLHAIFALSNVLAIGYGLVALIGIRATAEDLMLQMMDGLRRVGERLRPAEANRRLIAPPLQPVMHEDHSSSVKVLQPILICQEQSTPECEVTKRRKIQTRVCEIPTSANSIQTVQLVTVIANGKPSNTLVRRINASGGMCV
jgi:hypothetical protein